ncbi:2,3-diaminopropionate biosynthesis protein SbnA [Bacillus mojavensis]|nr:2,3-diaminopropionate biosynthesis protein SbnA [Bacillus mojavensis]
MDLLNKVGKTPLIRLTMDGFNLTDIFVKLEYYNPTGSVKDRAASYILPKLLNDNLINQDTTIIESSSGNFGISLSTYCRFLDLNFLCVIDPNITTVNEVLIKNLSSEVIKVMVPDKHGGYLLSRINKVKELLKTRENSYWINQYASYYNAEAYYESLGSEICEELDHIDYLFMGVSSGGTITGVSQRVKEKFPSCKVIAVDTEGSVIFGGQAKKRYIPGVGSSMVPNILTQSRIDDVVIIEEYKAVQMCHRLLRENSMLVGGSSGLVLSAIEKYFRGKNLSIRPRILTIFPDRGERYMDTIYNADWCNRFLSISTTVN